MNARYQLEFKNAEYDADLEKSAHLRLAELLTLAPPDATAVAVIEERDRYFVSRVEVKSRYRTFEEKAAGTTAYSTVRRALERLEDQLYRWRFGGGTDTPARPVSQFGQLLTG